MLNSDDRYTPVALNCLKRTVQDGRPIVLWIGAGASLWAELPSWRESARQLRRTFKKEVADFPDERASSLITAEDYPGLYQICRDVDLTLYKQVLVKQFSAPDLTGLYRDFIERVKSLATIQVLTTNVDLCLEQSLGPIDVIERTDIERCAQSIQNRLPFISKLHGSISSVNSTVFTTADYERLVHDTRYVSGLKAALASSSVVFLGYGLRDRYLLEVLEQNQSEHNLYGSGPHFLVTQDAGPPENGVYRISYKTTLHPDHRAALTVLNVIEQAKTVPAVELISAASSSQQTTTPTRSGFYISDFRPSGTYQTGQTLGLARPGGNDPIEAITGLGFTEGELPNNATVAFHDLAVGLICFDEAYLPLSSVGVFHERASAPIFWDLISTGSVKFVDIVHDPFIVSTSDRALGDVGIARIQDPNQLDDRSSMSQIRRMLKALPGHEAEGDRRIESLVDHVVSFSDSERLGLPAMVRDALLLPRVSRLIGFSDYLMPNTIPRWLAHPTLRLAHLVQTGLICDRLKIRASRVPFGGSSLLSAAFSVKPGEQNVYEYASFVMSGRYGTNLSEMLEKRPALLLDIVRFRETAEGESLRREISERLETNGESEFSAAIDGSLRRALPSALIQAARNTFSGLVKTSNPSASAAAIWSDANADDGALRLWRDRSRQLLLEQAKLRDVKPESPCLCG